MDAFFELLRTGDRLYSEAVLGNVERNNQTPLEPQGEHPRVTAGREAEEAMRQRLLSAGIDKTCVFQNLRIPTTRTTSTSRETCGFEISQRITRCGRREIDFVVLSRCGIWVLEIKHWVGEVSCPPGGGWLQTRPDGSKTLHPDPVALITTKASLLAEHLDANGCGVPSDTLKPRLVLLQDRIGLPTLQRDDCRVVAGKDGIADLFSEMTGSKFLFLEPILPGWLSGAILSTTALTEVKRALGATLGTWDTLKSRDGGIIIGDYRGLGLAEVPGPAGRTEAEAASARSTFARAVRRGALSSVVFWKDDASIFDWLSGHLGSRYRATIQPIRCDTFDLSILAETLIGPESALCSWVRGDATLDIILRPTDAVIFHRAGREFPERWPIATVRELIFSRV